MRPYGPWGALTWEGLISSAVIPPRDPEHVEVTPLSCNTNPFISPELAFSTSLSLPPCSVFYFPPLLFVVMGLKKKICLLAYLFLITPIIYKYILVIKYSNKTEVCKVKNKLLPLPPVLFSSLEVITIISLVYIFLEISL